MKQQAPLVNDSALMHNRIPSANSTETYTESGPGNGLGLDIDFGHVTDFDEAIRHVVKTCIATELDCSIQGLE